MKIEAVKLSMLYGIPVSKCERWIPYLNEAFDFAGISTIQRAAAFLAQIGHESGRLKYVRELWGPTSQQLRYEGTDLAERLGNTEKGDGFLYRGRGLIQVTGRYNYRKTYSNLSKYFTDVPDFEEEPSRLSEQRWAALSAGMYWIDNNLNSFVDKGDFVGLTKAINGGTNGLQDRQELFIRALSIL